MPDIGAITAAISDAAKVVEGVQKISSVLNGPRSCVIQVENHTDYPLTLGLNGSSHGGYGVPPPSVIDPRTVAIFGAQSSAWSIATGCEGSICREFKGDSVFFMSWDNPFIGNNTCSSGTSGFFEAGGFHLPSGNPVPGFSASGLAGEGNEKAVMRYELRPV